MVQIGGNPMDYFQAGRAGGAARSPALGIGNAIRGILQHSQKMGLIQAQTEGNLKSAIGAAQYKEQLNQPVGFPGGVVPKATEEGGMLKTPAYDDRGRPTGGFDYKSKPQPNIYTFMTPGEDTMTPKTPQLSDEEAYQLYLQMLQGT